MKKLYRSKTNSIVSGVLGGIGEYLELDPVVVRIIFLILTCFTAFFPGLLFYIVALFVIPKRPITETPSESREKTNDTENSVPQTEKTPTIVTEEK